MAQLDLPPMETHGSIARDFEHAVIDDDKSVKSNKSARSVKSHKSADEEWHQERRGSHNPVVARRSTFRRAIHNRQREAGNASRESSSSRSTSPPNSVDAFAPPKPPRGRAGTVNSKAGSVDNLSLHRTVSHSSHPRHRPTFGEEGTAGGRTDAASCRSSVQEDVCFPPEVPPNTYTIDFEDLEEFVAQTHTKTPVAHPFMPHFTKQNEKQKRVFQDLRKGEVALAVPDGGLEGCPNVIVEDHDHVGLDEKDGELESFQG